MRFTDAQLMTANGVNTRESGATMIHSGDTKPASNGRMGRHVARFDSRTASSPLLYLTEL
jgi:hypothetical protein